MATDDGRRHGLERARTSEIGFLVESKRRRSEEPSGGKEAGVSALFPVRSGGNVEGGVEIWENKKAAVESPGWGRWRMERQTLWVVALCARVVGQGLVPTARRRGCPRGGLAACRNVWYDE